MSSIKTLIKNIKSLIQVDNKNQTRPRIGEDMNYLPRLDNAWILIEKEIILDYGEMKTCPNGIDHVIDAKGKYVLPTWIDSHTHIVFAETREMEFEARLKGVSYQEIAKNGGGILNSARKLNELDTETLFLDAIQRIEEVISYGTGLLEIKSGYGLSFESELKMLRVIKKLNNALNIDIKSTFLGAHAIPEKFKNDRTGYVDLIINKMLPQVAKEKLADYIDVFCEKVAFSPIETAQIILAGKKHGLVPKVHTNQFNSMGGIEVCVDHGALSVDHLEVLNEKEINYLKKGNTMPVLLPSAPFFLNDPYPPARGIIDAGLPVALASDFNPGSSPSGNMQFVMSLACVKMKMTPNEVINASTINAAFALGEEANYGTIKRGKFANLIITKEIRNLAVIPYLFGTNVVEKTIIKGKVD